MTIEQIIAEKARIAKEARVTAIGETFNGMQDDNVEILAAKSVNHDIVENAKLNDRRDIGVQAIFQAYLNIIPENLNEEIGEEFTDIFRTLPLYVSGEKLFAEMRKYADINVGSDNIQEAIDELRVNYESNVYKKYSNLLDKQLNESVDNSPIEQTFKRLCRKDIERGLQIGDELGEQNILLANMSYLFNEITEAYSSVFKSELMKNKFKEKFNNKLEEI